MIISDLLEKSYSLEHTASLYARSNFYYAQSCGFFRCGQRYKVTRRNYNSILVGHTLAGQGLLEYKDHAYTLSPQKTFIIDCTVPHMYKSTDGAQTPWEFVWLHFNGLECRSICEKVLQGDGAVYDDTDDDFVCIKIRTILDSLRQRNRQIDILSNKIITEILTHFMLKSTGGKEIDVLPQMIGTIVDFIESNYSTALTLDIIAKKVNLNKHHMSRLFKKHTGYSPYEYLINYRLSQAKHMLKNTQCTIAEIASLIGFESPSNFIKLFKSQESVTPFKFRGFWQ